jgi:DNA-binding PadR family transcriptional regulator
MTDRLASLSDKERLILELLGRARQMYGLELVAASEGALKRGTVYVTLGRMEAKGYVSSRQEADSPAQGGLPRRLYEATAYGRELLGAWTSARRRLALRLAR